MGVVYKATDQILMRTVALKVLSQKLKDNDVALEYFMREARASAALQHINIVTVYDIGAFQDGTIYLAMEFVDGKTLKQLVSSTGPFPTRFLIQLAMHTCRGLQYAHDHGIVHRDIKSSNLMLTKKDKTLKILDFGLAKVINEIEKNSTQAIGTPYYMSPEQIQGTEIDNRSDVYSLGVTLFELATGQLPFTKGDLPYKHVHEQPPMPSSINPKINPDLEQVILKMLKKAPDDRFPSCHAVIQALKAIRIESN
jgi:serine/threonine-protein kinase